MLYRIDKVDFVSITSSKYDDLASYAASATSLPLEDYGQARRGARQAYGEHPCAELAVFLSEGYFYFGYNWDSTKSLQKTVKLGNHFAWTSCERSFFWNRFLMKPIMKFFTSLVGSEKRAIQSDGIFVACFEGFADIQEFVFGQNRAAFAVFSRISCKRAGTRYRSRGIDDDGNVSNFVETETLFAHPDFTFSHIIIRGTVPIFWDQQGFQLGFPRIQLTRTPPATQPAFDRHFTNLKDSYGLVHVVDLLNQKEGQAEHVLSNAFDFHIRKYPDVGALSQTTFDVYAVCKNSNFEKLESLFHLIGRDLQVFGYFVMDPAGTIVREQKGIFRVNCLDCLDRTNIVQNYIVKRTMDLFVRTYLLGSGNTYDAYLFQNFLSELWSSNGDQLSRIYTGSNAIKSSYGRLGKFTFSSLLEDFKNNAKRFYSNNFSEKVRQRAIDVLLGKTAELSPVIIYSPSRDAVEGELERRKKEYCDREQLIVQVLTWNTNAAIPLSGEDYSPLISVPKGMSLATLLTL
jgi:hypothetical protein